MSWQDDEEIDKLEVEIERLEKIVIEQQLLLGVRAAADDCPKCRAACDGERNALGMAASLGRDNERLRAALKEIQAYSVGDPRPRHTWYYDRAEAALGPQQSGEQATRELDAEIDAELMRRDSQQNTKVSK